MTSSPDSAMSRPLGRTGMRVFPIAYGLWRFAGTSVAAATAKLQAAMAVGINLFDIADVYGYDGHSGFGDAEELLGRVFAATPSLRTDMILATKGGVDPGVPYNSGGTYLVDACEDSLQRMRTDYVDLYQVHRPDLLAHPEEVAAALSRLYRDGKIRAVGVSNYAPSQVDALQRFLDLPLATHQPEISPWRLDPFFDGVLDQCMRMQMTPLAWSPMAAGLLAISPAKAREEKQPARLVALLECLDRVAADHGCDRGAVVLAFLLSHPAGIVPIVGTQRVERIQRAVEALSVELPRQEWYEIVQASMGTRLP
ncbi:aldo/keto reductase [Haliangium sp.]|uniref:aldo/keto reductase n=1 Tax=Haliangium sp. TaxID=2663208 RepID=UPI003D0FFC84